MDWLRADLRNAVRLLTRRPIHAWLAVLTLAIGLGLNAVTFSAINSLLFRPARVAGGENIGWIAVASQNEPEPLASMSLPMYERVRRDARTLESVAAEGRLPLAHQTGDATRQIWALVVSPDYFSTVKVPLAFGRLCASTRLTSPASLSRSIVRSRASSASWTTTSKVRLASSRLTWSCH